MCIYIYTHPYIYILYPHIYIYIHPHIYIILYYIILYYIILYYIILYHIILYYIILYYIILYIYTNLYMYSINDNFLCDIFRSWRSKPPPASIPETWNDHWGRYWWNSSSWEMVYHILSPLLFEVFNLFTYFPTGAGFCNHPLVLFIDGKYMG